MCNVLGPMVQDIPMQEQIPPQMDSKPGMGAAAAVATKYDTSPPLLHQNPPPIPAETANLGAFDMAQLIAMLAEMRGETREMKHEIKEEMNENVKQMKDEMKKMRGEMRQVGQCLQAGKRATPSAATNELEGSAPAGEDRVSRETCWTRHEVTETVTQRGKLNGVTETCTRETRRQVTELTETRETVVERLHGVEEKDGVKDAHTHTHR